jgi:hypothetical protein
MHHRFDTFNQARTTFSATRHSAEAVTSESADGFRTPPKLPNRRELHLVLLIRNPMGCATSISLQLEREVVWEM